MLLTPVPNLPASAIGELGETLVRAHLIAKGYSCHAIKTEGCVYDHLVDSGSTALPDGLGLLRVQTKTKLTGRVQSPRHKTPSYVFQMRRGTQGDTVRHYEKGTVDLFAFVALDIQRIAFWVPNGQRELFLRRPGPKSPHQPNARDWDDLTFEAAVAELAA